MIPRSPDTEVWAEELQFELLRKAGPARRLELSFDLSAMVWNGVRASIDRRYPQETQDQRDQRFLTQLYGEPLAVAFIAYRQRIVGPKSEQLDA